MTAREVTVLPARGNASPKKLKLVQRRQLAIELRGQGVTYERIAQIIVKKFPNDFPNYTESMAAKDVKQVLAAIKQDTLEDAELMRLLESERLDMVLAAIYKQVKAGNLQAIDRWIDTIEARCKLWGLNLPPADRPAKTDNATGIELELIINDGSDNYSALSSNAS